MSTLMIFDIFTSRFSLEVKSNLNICLLSLSSRAMLLGIYLYNKLRQEKESSERNSIINVEKDLSGKQMWELIKRKAVLVKNLSPYSMITMGT